MAKKGKNEDSSMGLVLLVLLLLGTVGYVYMYDKKAKENNNKPVQTKKEEEKYTEKEIDTLYEKFKLDITDENTTISKTDFVFNETEKTPLKLSDDLKIVYSMNNMYTSYIENDNSKRPNIKDYVYSGKFIKSKSVNNISSLYLNVKPNHKTVYTYTDYYLYDSKNDGYYVYRRKYESKIKKVTYHKGSWDDKYLYIDEYVAYTNPTTTPATSYTHHNNLLPIDITETNITENLDIIDHYKYTFEFNDKSDAFQLVKIEYIKPNE